jgi:two-component system CheB/CheR fusion protein
MYFNSEGQARILPRFEFALNEGGFLFLGKAEVLLARGAAFMAVDAKRRIFVKVPKDQIRVEVLPGQDPPAVVSTEPSLGSLLRDLAIEIDPVGQLILGLDGRLMLANAEARRMFGLHANVIGRRLTELPALALPTDVRYVVEQALAERRSMQLKEVPATRPGGEPCYLDVAASPLETNAGQMQGIKVALVDVTQARQMREELQRSQKEQESTNEKLQSTNEELATTNEELQSTMEELETTNEELQSTNEELETMNEELQSTIEELETANTELEQRGEDLNRLNVYLESIMSSLRDGVVVLDPDLTVRSWNRRSEDLWGLRAEEVRGKHFLALDVGLPVEQLRPVIRACLAGEGLRRDQTVTVAAVNRKGRPVTLQVTAAALLDGKATAQGVILVMEEKLADPS